MIEPMEDYYYVNLIYFLDHVEKHGVYEFYSDDSEEDRVILQKLVDEDMIEFERLENRKDKNGNEYIASFYKVKL